MSFGLFTAPLGEIVEFHATSGTTGKPVVVGYTRNDIELWYQSTSMLSRRNARLKAAIRASAYALWPLRTFVVPTLVLGIRKRPEAGNMRAAASLAPNSVKSSACPESSNGL